MNCGSDLFHADCKDATIPMTNAGFQVFYGELVSTGTALFTITISVASSEFPENMVRAFNAMRCAFVSGWVDQWMLMAATYYTARHFGYHELIAFYVLSWYPYVCTCSKDV